MCIEEEGEGLLKLFDLVSLHVQINQQGSSANRVWTALLERVLFCATSSFIQGKRRLLRRNDKPTSTRTTKEKKPRWMHLVLNLSSSIMQPSIVTLDECRTVWRTENLTAMRTTGKCVMTGNFVGTFDVPSFPHRSDGLIHLTDEILLRCYYVHRLVG